VLDDCDWASVATAVRNFELNTAWTPHPIGTPTRLRAARATNVAQGLLVGLLIARLVDRMTFSCGKLLDMRRI